MRFRNILVVLICYYPTSVVFADSPLCSIRVVIPNEPEELIMYENDFSLDKGLESINFLRTDFSKRIWGSNPTTDFNTWSGHYISYMNSLRFMEGALLKETALRLRLKSQLLEIQSPDSLDSKAAKKGFEDAKEKFCHFVNNSLYVD
jgi:hypothetical protein